MDSLDLDALRQQGEQYRRLARRRLVRLVFVFALLLLIYFTVRIDPSGYGTLYRFENSTWHVVPGPFAGVPYEVKISSANTVWVYTTIFGGLYRYDGKAWTAYDRRDFNTKSDNISSFTLQGEDVWAIADTSVVHWDGSRWTSYDNIFRSAEFTDIVAGNFGVMTVNDAGQIAQFDGQAWKVTEAESTLPGFSNSGTSYSSLAAVHNQVWLLDGGLWKFDGLAWSLVQRQVPSYRLVAVDSDTLWGVSRYHLDAFNTVTQQWTSYSLPATLTQADIYQLSRRDDLLWAATSSGIRAFDGETWKSIGVPLPQNGTVPSLALDPQGRVWAAVNATELTHSSFQSTLGLRNLLSNLMPLVLWLALILLYVIPALRIGYRRAAPFRGKIAELLPGIQKYAPTYTNAEKAFRQRRLLYFVLLGILLFLGFSKASFVVIAAIGITMVILWCISPMLIRYLDHTLDAANRAYLRRNMLVTALMMGYLSGLIFVFLALLTPPFILLINDNVIATVLVALVSIALAYALYYCTFAFPVLRIYRGALARGDYQKALGQITALRRRVPKYFSFMFAHGYILLIAGQSEEAETLWREILAEVQNGAIGIQAICLINLADALNQQARFSEALPLLMTAVQMVPERGVFYRELVNYYQFQHVNAERAFDLSECMIRFSQRSRIGFGLSRYSWTATLAVRALAFANVQRYEEAAAVLGQIFRQADRQFIPGMAFLSCQAAEIEFLKGNHMAAIANFDKAIALDAKGRAGNLARKRMADLAGTDHPT